MVSYVAVQKDQLNRIFFEDFLLWSKKDHEPRLKKLLNDYLVEHPDVDTVKLAKEMPVILSLLHLHLEVGLGPL